MKRCILIAAVLVITAIVLSRWTVFGKRIAVVAEPVTERESTTAQQFPVVIRQPDGPLMLTTGEHDDAGGAIQVRCATCHALRQPNTAIKSGGDLKEFHRGLKFHHGQLSCLSCHNLTNYDTFRLADGKPLEYRHVMDLCAQCHGPQARDYHHGAHGGMTGYWDLTKGPRQRNNCIDCHDPHAPAYPKVRPVFPPNDRFPPVPHKH